MNAEGKGNCGEQKLPKLRSDMEDRMNLDWQGTRSFPWGLGSSGRGAGKASCRHCQHLERDESRPYSPTGTGGFRVAGNSRGRRSPFPFLTSIFAAV